MDYADPSFLPYFGDLVAEDLRFGFAPGVEEAFVPPGPHDAFRAGRRASREPDDVAPPPRRGVAREVTPAAAGASRGGGGATRRTTKRKPAAARRRRDPNKPKGWITANLTYANANRARVVADNPDATFGDVARLLSAEYKNLSPRDKELWTKASEEDRARYDREMLAYAPPSPAASAGCRREAADDFVSPEATAGSPKATKPKRRKKDPNAPKRSLSAWQIYSSGEARKRVQASFERPSLKEVMAVLSEQFKALPRDERAALDARASADRDRYEREKAAYEARSGASQR
ncbi:hypothetical protein ACHAWF_007222 [Thalassiosira exigua]